MADGAQQTSTPLARIFKNAGALVSAKGLAGAMSLAYLAIAARALGPDGMGALVLAHAYAMTVAGIARFQSWQAVIRFGAPMLAKDDRPAFKALARFTIRIDLLSALLGVALALLAAPFAARAFGWSDDVVRLVYLYAFAVPFLMGATPTGVLRLFDRFKTLGGQMTVMPGVRLAGALAAWGLGGGVEAFLLVWIVSAFANGASLWMLGWRELSARGLAPRLTGESEGPRDPQWFPFMVKTNAASTLDLMNESVPVLLVGAIAGGAAAGFFQLAQNVTNLLAHPTNMLNHATYPELARVEAEKGRAAMVSVAAKSALLAAAAAAPLILLFVLFREQIATLVGGKAFTPAAAIIAGMALYQLIRIPTVVFDSAAVARGKAGYALAAQAMGAVALVAGMAVLLPPVGVVAAAIALALGRAAMLAVLIPALLIRGRGSS
ncbi:MAG: oligosaccharide flippase family protein [Parvularculaceae bacterium]|nr:oligosaccharide flippase family protein [Parvularculaceae bacterium]